MRIVKPSRTSGGESPLYIENPDIYQDTNMVAALEKLLECDSWESESTPELNVRDMLRN